MLTCDRYKINTVQISCLKTAKRDANLVTTSTTSSPCLKRSHNHYYSPFFTGKMISDEEFEHKKNKILSIYGTSEDNPYLKEIFSTFNKENINLASTLLLDRTISKNELDIPEILNAATQENSQFAEKLCRDIEFPKSLIPNIINIISKDNLPFAELLYDDKLYLEMEEILTTFNKDKIAGISKYMNFLPTEDKELFDKALCNKIKTSCGIGNEIFSLSKLYNNYDVEKRQIFSEINTKNFPLFEHFINNNLPKTQLLSLAAILETYNEYSNLFKHENIKELIARLEKIYASGYETPTRVIVRENSINLISINIPWSNFVQEMYLMSIFDDKTAAAFFKNNPKDVNEYFKQTKTLSYEEKNILKQLLNTKNTDGTPLLYQQKLDLLNLMNIYKLINFPINKIQKIADSGYIDILNLQQELFLHILKTCTNLNDKELNSIPQNKINDWEFKFTKELYAEIMSDKMEISQVYKDLIKNATLNNFKHYIQNSDNVYGKKNERTKKLFKLYNLDYDKWLNPTSANNIRYISGNETQQKLFQIKNQIENDIESLRKSSPQIKKYIDKILCKFIKDDKFIIPIKACSSPIKLKNFIKGLNISLNKVWKRAEIAQNNKWTTTDNNKRLQINHTYTILNNIILVTNTQNEQDNISYNDILFENKKPLFQLTLSTRDHLKKLISDLDKLNSNNEAAELDLTIKMWDRYPQKDLFQGNYSTCCIGIGRSNGQMMPHYLLNTAFNMIELKDNKTGNIIGNALCYWANNEKGKPALIIDNIEINNNSKPKISEHRDKELRDSIVQYAKNIAKEVSCNQDAKVYLGTRFNDVSTKDLETVEEHLCFIGNLACKNIYLDVYNGTTSEDLTLYNLNTKLYEL